MSESVPEANDADLAEQSVPVDEASDADDDALDTLDEDFVLNGEADPADVFEQHQRVPSADDDYDYER